MILIEIIFNNSNRNRNNRFFNANNGIQNLELGLFKILGLYKISSVSTERFGST